ncbi:iron transporter [Patulibacter defluvii]|uniref:iron transporter n=1 Tax=Patulibacter defluvii TaxID=3095358 RepID=UPI002A754B41|nr:iron transporter [Patulibacter sp. DM4]
MTPFTRSLLATGAAAALATAVGGCGGDEPAVRGSGTTAAHPTTTGGGHGGHGDGQMSSVRLGSAQRDDLRVEVAAMREAVTFTVSEGGRMRKHPPAPGDNAHVMVLVSDADSRDRLPDAAVTAQITGPGGVAVHNGPLYPMVGMGVGLHYGDNMRLARSGRYRASIVVGPPQIGRHPEVADRYRKPVRLDVPFTWDAR